MSARPREAAGETVTIKPEDVGTLNPETADSTPGKPAEDTPAKDLPEGVTGAQAAAAATFLLSINKRHDIARIPLHEFIDRTIAKCAMNCTVPKLAHKHKMYAAKIEEWKELRATLQKMNRIPAGA